MPPSGGEKKPAKRRVPDSLRRRTLVSCDRCKTRRIRCFRATENEPCTSCINGGTKCESKLPRKQRVYGSVERFSLRYRALDAFVRGLFPDQDTDDIDELFRLAKARSIPMPSADDQAPALDAFSHQSPTPATTAPPGPGEPPWSRYDLPASEIVQERLIAAPHGILHYVGPSSTFDFATLIRHLVVKHGGIPQRPRERDSDRRRLQADFANVKVSKALEPRFNGHPAATVRPVNQETDRPISLADVNDQLYTVLPSRSWRVPSVPTNTLLRDLLPNKNLSDCLVQAYFENVQTHYPVFHRGVFQLRYESLWHANTGPSHAPEIGWICSLFMVFVLGAEVLGVEKCPEAPVVQDRYMKLVRDRFEQLAFSSSLENIQALLLIQLYEHNSGERNTAWVFLGLASRMAVSLGMHREGVNHSYNAIEVHTRRVVWWTLYMFERTLSFILGRPATIDAKDVNVQLPDEHAHGGQEVLPGLQVSVLGLIDISTRMKRLVTTASDKYTDEEALLAYAVHTQQILQELDAWKARLPPQLSPESQSILPQHRREILMINAYYHHYRSVVTRSFLCCKVNRNIDRLLQGGSTSLPSATIESLSQECRASAAAEMAYFLQLSAYGLLEGVAWTDFYYVYHAMLILSLDFLGRPRDAPEDAEDLAIKSQTAAMIGICRNQKLAPTYQILSKIAIDFAKIVGITGPEATPAQDQQKISDIFEHPRPVLSNMPPSQHFGLPESTVPHVAQNHTPLDLPELASWVAQANNDMAWDFWDISRIDVNFLPDPVHYPGAYGAANLMNDEQPPAWPR
jgi:proline utilization trans-activator